MFRRVLAALLLTAAVFVTVYADDAKKPDTPGRDEAALQQERLRKQYSEFEQALLRLAQRLERSTKPEDLTRAKTLKEAIRKSSDENITTKFDKLVATLKASKAVDLQDIKEAMDQSQELSQGLRAILALLLSDNRDEQLKAERENLKQLLARLDKVIRDQKVARAQTEGGRLDKEKLLNTQEKVTKDTKGLSEALKKAQAKNNSEPKNGKDPKDGKDGKDSKDGKDAKKDGKDGKGDKKDGKDSKEGKDGKDAKGDKQESKDAKDGKDSKGDKKDGKPSKGEPKDSKGGGKDGQPNDDDQQSQPSQPQQNEQLPGKKQVEDAIEDQKRAENNLKKEQRDKASRDQDDAVKKLEDARKKLEALLKQIREEELERKLADLQRRCERMLQMQTAVLEDTVRIDKAINLNTDRKPDRTQEQDSLKLSDRENEIVREADRALAILAEEGSAVAFAEVFTQTREDMKHVARRLGKVDVAHVTQAIEQDIITMLKEMIEALKQQQQQMQDKKNQPPPSNQQNPPPDSLLDQLAELKLIRSMQIQVNNRTTTYGKQYQGEQANEASIVQELLNLASRQQKIFQVTNDIARGKNK